MQENLLNRDVSQKKDLAVVKNVNVSWHKLVLITVPLLVLLMLDILLVCLFRLKKCVDSVKNVIRGRAEKI